MAERSTERYTGPAIGALVVAAIAIIAIQPSAALPVLAVAEFIVGAGCAVHVRTSLKRTKPAPQSAILFATFSLFWIGMGALSIWWYSQGE